MSNVNPEAVVIGRDFIFSEQAREVPIPMFEIAANPTIQLSEVKARRFFIVDRAQIKAQEELRAEEELRQKEEELIARLKKARRVINAIFEVDLNG